MNNALPKSDEENLINEEKSSEVNATIIDDKRDNVTSSIVYSGSSDTLESEKHVKNASSNYFRHIDHTKIQSDTKDIIDDSGDNIIHLKRVTTTTTTPTIPTIRTTLPNTFSNAGGNGGKLDDVHMLTSDSVIRKRHRRRRQGRYTFIDRKYFFHILPQKCFFCSSKLNRKSIKKSKSKQDNYQERFEKLKHELNRPVITSEFFKQKHIESTRKTKKDLEENGKDWLVNDMPEGMPPPLSEIDLNIVSKKRSTVETMLTELTTEMPTVESVSDSERY